MRTLAGFLAALLGVSSLLAAIWAFFQLMPLVTDVLVLRRASAYIPAVFEVEWATFDEDHPIAIGTIGRKRETLSLRDVLPRKAASLDDLQDLMASTERIDVLYDDRGTKTSFEGARLRVLPATPDLRADRWRRVQRTLLVGYGPAILLLGAGLILTWVGGKRLGCWFGPALFFFAVQPLFALFILVVERYS
jgi:hypothetical protein